jgi:hypothetical protein
MWVAEFSNMDETHEVSGSKAGTAQARTPNYQLRKVYIRGQSFWKYSGLSVEVVNQSPNRVRRHDSRERWHCTLLRTVKCHERDGRVRARIISNYRLYLSY